MNHIRSSSPSLAASLIPIATLIFGLVTLILIFGAEDIQRLGQPLLLLAAVVSVLISVTLYRRTAKAFKIGIYKAAVQVLPTVPILLLISTVAATWMLSGVVPTLICYGLELLNPTLFLFTACTICALISVLSGSSWTTIATVGLAFMGIGTLWGYHPGWIAGAIISGAYFGDKVSPLSDTTVLASSTCGVKLFPHIRYMMITTIPALSIALVVFAVVGILHSGNSNEMSSDMIDALHNTFAINPWCLLIPAITIIILAMRAGTKLTLTASTLLGIAGIFIFQPDILARLENSAVASLPTHVNAVAHLLVTSTTLSTGNEQLDALVSTGGMEGMLPTIALILCAMCFGGAMMGSGMLFTITHAITSRLSKTRNIVISTVLTGLMLNSCTGDQYLSIILNGNLYRNLYRRRGLEPRLLSRSIEDSTSVTSVLIPWNSCGLTQSAVLGVATLTYLPCCIFNIASPLVTIFIASIGFRTRLRSQVEVTA
ncbi:MAG: sodium:proton antiporter [Muribaculum sp.]|nr:sodium:proton antiporter [Muribaculum sp.]